MEREHKMIKAVIFDMDGVIVDSEPLYCEVIEGFHKSYGKEAPYEYLASMVGKSNQDTWQQTLAIWKDEITFEEYHRLYHVYEEAHPIQFKEAIFDGMIHVLTQLKKEGYRLAIASSSPLKAIKSVMKECEIESFFEFTLSGEMFTHSKPNPEIYLATVEKLGLSKDECIIVEDSLYGIQAGKDAGVKVIAKIDNRYGADASKADYRFHDYHEFMELFHNIKTTDK